MPITWYVNILCEIQNSKPELTLNVLWELDACDPEFTAHCNLETDSCKSTLMVHVLCEIQNSDPGQVLWEDHAQNPGLMVYVLWAAHYCMLAFVVDVLWVDDIYKPSTQDTSKLGKNMSTTQHTL